MGAYLIHRSSLEKESYEKIIAVSLIFVIVIPLLIASFLGLPFNDIPSGLIRFLGYSLEPSVLMTLFLNRKLFLKKSAHKTS